MKGVSLSLVGKKVGMTSVFDEEGKIVPVTLINVVNSKIVELKSQEKHGYNAIKVVYEGLSKNKYKKPVKSYLEKLKIKHRVKQQEFRVTNSNDYKVGQEIGLGLLKDIDYVDVTGQTKGKGFQGTIKRHGFSGGPKTHGSHFHRAPGSIGMCSYPGRVLKGKKMAGRMGGDKKTNLSLKLFKVDTEKNVVLVKGSVPGANNGELFIRKAIKK